VALYEEVKKRLLGAAAELLHLTASFRAPPSIQSFVNGAFAMMAAGPNGSQAAYVPLQPSRPEITGRPTLVALPVPRPYGDYGKVVNWRIDVSFPESVGAFIDWLTSFSLFTPELENVAPSVALAVDDDKRERHLRSPQHAERHVS
jgi:ATP-dependent helicase/nuclease subunit A